MCVCVCVHAHVTTYVHVHTYIPTYMHMYTHIHTYKQAKESASHSTEFQGALYITKQQKKPSKNGKTNGGRDKAAITKQYFPNVQGRLRMKSNLTPNLVAMLTGHGRTTAYLHPFKLLKDATCICGQGDQTMDHLLNHCAVIHTQREVLKQNILKIGNWPASKQELITKYRDYNRL